MTERRPLVAIYFRMFSPYILARLRAATRHLNVIGIEGSRRSSVYAWEPQEGDEPFARHTLFTDETVEDQSSRVIISRVRAVLDATQPDVLCIGGWSHTEALAMLLWAREHGRHVVLMSESSEHDHVRKPWREWAKLRIVQLCDAALVGGIPQRNYAQMLGLAGDRVFIGYDAIDNDHFAAGAIAARENAVEARRRLNLPERYFLASCRFVEKKNLRRLLDAFAAYRETAASAAWELVLLGDGDLRTELEARAATLGVAGVTRFVGFRQYEELPFYYGLAGAFVHVSTTEQWGLVVNEALASGLAVLVSENVGCAQDLVEIGGNGWTVDPFDTRAIAAGLARLSSPDSDREAMAVVGKMIVGRYGPDRFGEGLADAVQVARKSPPRRAALASRLLLHWLANRSTRDGD